MFFEPQNHDSQKISTFKKIPNLNRKRAKLNVGINLFLQNLNEVDKLSATTIVLEILHFPPSMQASQVDKTLGILYLICT